MTTDTPKALPAVKQFCPSLSLRKVTEEGAVLVDVREPAEVAGSAIDLPGVVYLPLSELEHRYAELPGDRQLIMVCGVGQRSLKAAYYLLYQGYTQVANMEDGLAKWARKGLPMRGEAGAAVACCVPSGSGDGCCSLSPAVAGKRCC